MLSGCAGQVDDLMSVSAKAGLAARVWISRWRQPQPVLAWLAIGAVLALTLIQSERGSGALAGGPATGVAVAEDARGDIGSGVAWVFFLLAIMAIPTGLFLFIQALRRLWSGRWIPAGSPAPRHGFYVEGFALWLALGMLPGMLAESIRSWTGWSGAVLQAALFPLGLLVLLWPTCAV
jgi:hypothetical protein